MSYCIEIRIYLKGFFGEIMQSRKFVFYICIALSIIAIIGFFVGLTSGWWAIAPIILTLIGIYDIKQSKHAILYNYPIIGHLRYMIESVGPEFRQYIIESDHQESPFSRNQRSLVYQRSKNVSDVRSFGANLNMKQDNYEWATHSMKASNIATENIRIVVGEERAKPYKMSVFNISAMSFGALSGNAITALNTGARMGGFAQDTGEGSVSPYHKKGGGDLIWELGSGYFGCRDELGNFSEEKFQKVASDEQIKMIEVKLSQGAKPGHGGVLPSSKITPEIAATRGIPMGVDCVSPASHSAFSNPIEMMYFIQKLRDLSGDKPVGFKFCVGHKWEFFAIVKAMIKTGITPDFIVVDGSEGGTGAAPIEFAENIGSPLHESLLFVSNTLNAVGLRKKIKLGASGKIISAFDMVRAFALGADFMNSGRGFMFSLGCIQALSCSNSKCPTGIATQDPERQKALNIEEKSMRVYNFHKNTMHALKEVLQAMGVQHTDDIKPYHIMRRIDPQTVSSYEDIMNFVKTGNSLIVKDMDNHTNDALPLDMRKWWDRSSAETFDLKV